MIVTEIFFFKLCKDKETKNWIHYFNWVPLSHWKTGIYVSEEHKPLTSRYYFHHLNGFWLNSSPVTSLPGEKPWMKRSQDGEEETLFQHVFLSALKKKWYLWCMPWDLKKRLTWITLPSLLVYGVSLRLSSARIEPNWIIPKCLLIMNLQAQAMWLGPWCLTCHSSLWSSSF